MFWWCFWFAGSLTAPNHPSGLTATSQAGWEDYWGRLRQECSKVCISRLYTHAVFYLLGRFFFPLAVTWLIIQFTEMPLFLRDLLLPDGNRVSAFSVASTAIAAAQWSSSQVWTTLLYPCLNVKTELCMHDWFNWLYFTLQPQQSLEPASEYSYLQEGYVPCSQVSWVHHLKRQHSYSLNRFAIELS